MSTAPALLTQLNGLRDDFPGLLTADGKPWHYLDSAASAQKLKPGIITGIGDVNGDGYGDIVTGEEWDPSKDGSEPSVPESATGGKVHIIFGSVVDNTSG